MISFKYFFGLCIILLNLSNIFGDYYQPEQVHLSLGSNGRDIVITWSTPNATEQSLVAYGSNNLDSIATGTYELFYDGGIEQRVQEIHRVTLTDLEPDTTYLYRCGSDEGWSPIYFFQTYPDTEDWSPRFAIYGDLGLGGYSMPFLQEEAPTGIYNAIFHNGDFAYDFHDDNGTVGDQFMRQIEPIAAYVPYMTTPGNHESHYNFSHYRKRFTMPGDTEGLYYSINIGPVHFIAFSSELYYYLSPPNPLYTLDNVRQQYEWLVNDLETAQQNRDSQPWIIAIAHRPMYCTSTNKLGDDCTNILTKVRVGLEDTFEYGLESLFYHYGVDCLIWSHEHTYERFYPLYNYTANLQPDTDPFVNPNGPVHLLTGVAGCHEKEDDFVIPAPSYSASRSRNYGYTRLTANNKTHLYFEQVSVKGYPMDNNIDDNISSTDDEPKIIDQFWIVKDNVYSYVRDNFC